MKTFKEWHKENAHLVQSHPYDLERAYIAGAEEQHKKDTAFAAWIGSSEINYYFGSTKEAYEYWESKYEH